jgi:16S rRNA processing protein RimM
MPRPEWIEVGRISRPHGVHGEVRVALSSDNPERFVAGAQLHARPGRVGTAGARLQEQVRLTIHSVRGDGDFPIVAFSEIADRGRAEAFSGYVLEIRSSQLPELDDDEYYPFDLIGLQARDSSGSILGPINDVLGSPAHAILVVALRSGGEALVPFVLAAVPVVDLRQGYLVVDTEFASLAGVPNAERAAESEAAHAAPTAQQPEAEGTGS